MIILSYILPFTWIFELIFEIYVLYNLFKFIKFIYSITFRPKKDLIKRYGENSYVMITGATDGIGKGWAFAFAKRGFNLILVSRTESKLIKTKEEIEKIHKVKIEIIPFNFSSQFSISEYEKSFSPIIEKLDISVLVNNVGYSHEDYTFKIKDNEELLSYINVNIVSQTVLTKMLMDRLNKRKNKSAIISMSSIAGDFAYLGNAIYSATKAYNDYFSRALFGEYGYESGNIDFISSKPSYIESNMSQMKPDGFDCIRVDQHVEAVLGELGYTDETFGYWSHKLQGFAMRRVPTVVQRFFMMDSKKKEEKIQARHQKKD